MSTCHGAVDLPDAAVALHRHPQVAARDGGVLHPAVVASVLFGQRRDVGRGVVRNFVALVAGDGLTAAADRVRRADIGAGRHAPTRGHDFETIRPGFELAPGCYADRRFTVGLEPQKVAMAAGDGDRRPGRQDAGAGDEPTGNGVTQAEGHTASASQIADRRDSSAERLPCAGYSTQQKLLIVLGQEIAQGMRGVAEDEMHVAVDDTGAHGCGRAIAHRGPGTPRKITATLRNQVVQLKVTLAGKSVRLESAADIELLAGERLQVEIA